MHYCVCQIIGYTSTWYLGPATTVTIRFPDLYAQGPRKFDHLMFLVVIGLKTNCYSISRVETVFGGHEVSALYAVPLRSFTEKRSVFQRSIATRVGKLEI